MSTDVEELLRMGLDRLPAPSPAGEERTAAVVRGIVLGRGGRGRPGRRLVVATACAAVAAIAGGVGLWLHERGGPAQQPMVIGALPDYGTNNIHVQAPIGANPFGSSGARLPLRTVARIADFTPLLPPHGPPPVSWFNAEAGPQLVLDYPGAGFRVVEQSLITCCGGGAEIDTRAGLEQEAAEMTGARVTSIGGFRALVAPPGDVGDGWYVQVTRSFNEVIVLGAPGVPLATLERVAASLRVMPLKEGVRR
jgi:hypothetical protein